MLRSKETNYVWHDRPLFSIFILFLVGDNDKLNLYFLKYFIGKFKLDSFNQMFSLNIQKGKGNRSFHCFQILSHPDTSQKCQVISLAEFWKPCSYFSLLTLCHDNFILTLASLGQCMLCRFEFLIQVTMSEVAISSCIIYKLL